MPRFTTGGDGSDRRVVARLYLLGGFFAVCFGVLISKAILFHLKDNDKLDKVALRQYRTAVRESTRRGKILDAQGRELAINIEAPSVWTDPRAVDNPEEAATQLAAILQLDRAKLLAQLTSSRKFAWINRWVTEEQAEKIRAFNFKGIFIEKENKRSYPNGQLASIILGAVGLDSEPLGGIELAMNDYLVQTTAPGSYQRDARGHLYLSPREMLNIRSPGAVELTIDTTIQYIAERELAKAIEATKSARGIVIVLDPHTGDLLALANYPTFDPNFYERYDLKQWRNIAVSDPYEPGSTFKMVVVANALEAGTVTPTQMIDCQGGEIHIGVDTLHDAHPHGMLSVADIIRVSSNIGAYKVEKTMGQARAYEAIKSFGFGEKTGIELPGESNGIVPNVKRWSEVQFATIAFGQGISATPLQMAVAMGAIANGGAVVKPHVVKRILGENGEALHERETEIVRRPISHETARTMTRMLEAVTQKGGTGTRAASLEYPVAGKTGTAQKAGRHGGYMEGRYYSSFIGFAPSDDARLVVYVGLDEPKGPYYGGLVAAPVFRDVVEKTLKYLKVPSRMGLTTAKKDASSVPVDGAVVAMPTTVPEIPAAPEVMPAVAEAGEGKWQLPDLTGLTMRDVAKLTRVATIDLRLIGSGVAIRQNPAPGSVVARGEEVVVEFKPML